MNLFIHGWLWKEERKRENQARRVRVEATRKKTEAEEGNEGICIETRRGGWSKNTQHLPHAEPSCCSETGSVSTIRLRAVACTVQISYIPRQRT